MQRFFHLLKTEPDPAYASRADYILKTILKYKPKQVLEVGCGRGFYLYCLTKFKFIQTIYGIDLNHEVLKAAKKNLNHKKIKLTRANIYKLPCKNQQFDLIICSEVLEHLQDDFKAMRELKRILKPKGKLIITVPHLNFPFFWDPLNYLLIKLFNKHINKSIWWLAGIWADHERLYSKATLLNLLNKTGFKTNAFRYSTHYCWPFMHFWLYGLGKNLVLYFPKLNQFNRFSFKDKKESLLVKIIKWPNKQERLYQNEQITTTNILATVSPKLK